MTNENKEPLKVGKIKAMKTEGFQTKAKKEKLQIIHLKHVSGKSHMLQLWDESELIIFTSKERLSLGA